jgi:hypothetical protein
MTNYRFNAISFSKMTQNQWCNLVQKEELKSKLKSESILCISKERFKINTVKLLGSAWLCVAQHTMCNLKFQDLNI